MTRSSSFRVAVGWSFVMDGGRQVIASVVSLVLAALLGPEVFGLAAMALVYVLFVELLLKQGMASAVIQRRDLGRDHLDTAFWIVVGTAAVLTVASIGLSGWWAAVNRTPDLRPVIVGLTPMVPLQGLIVVQEAILRRAFRFRALALRTNLSVLVGGVLGIVLALTGFGVWALVAQQVVTALVAAVILWAVSDWRPRLHATRRAARELLGFSSGSFLTSLGVFANNRADALLIGLLFGPLAVGLYRLADRLVELVIGVTVRALQSVSLPDLARVQDDPARFRQRTLRLLGISALLAVPALGVLAGAATPVLRLVGEEWLPATNALRLLCVAGAMRALFMLLGPMLQALGHPHRAAVLSWLAAALSVGGFLGAGWLVQDAPIDGQLLGLAGSRALLYGVVFTMIAVALLRRYVRASLRDLGTTVMPAFAAAAFAAAAGWLAWTLVAGGLRAVPAVAVTVAPSGALALAVLLATDGRFRGYVATAGRAVRQRVGPRRAGAPTAPREHSAGAPEESERIPPA